MVDLNMVKKRGFRCSVRKKIFYRKLDYNVAFSSFLVDLKALNLKLTKR